MDKVQIYTIIYLLSGVIFTNLMIKITNDEKVAWGTALNWIVKTTASLPFIGRIFGWW